MTSTDAFSSPGLRAGPYERPGLASQAWGYTRQATGWLDDRGRPAWFATAIVGLFVAPPVGVAILLFMLGTGRMFSRRHERHDRRAMSCGKRGARHETWSAARAALRPSGNHAFDAYKAETLRRLEEEQAQFEAFLHRLREAKDKAEFDEFMDDRARRASERGAEPGADSPEAA